MKNYFILIVCFIFMGQMILAQDVEDYLNDIVTTESEEYLKSYLQPLSTALSTAMGGALYHRAYTKGFPRVDIGISMAYVNIPDEDMLKKLGQSPFVLIVESQNSNTGLGIRFGTWLLERDFNPVYSHIGTVRAGNAGLNEHMKHQGIDPDSIRSKVLSLLK